MGELKLWTDGEDLYAAKDADEATKIRREMSGPDGDDIGPIELAAEPLTMVVDEDVETHTHREWIAMVTQGKPGYVASTNW